MFEVIEKLNKDLKEAAKRLEGRECRYLVDAYYMIQEYRKSLANQIRMSGDEPNALIGWMFEQAKVVENNIKRALDVYTDENPVGVWMKSIKGIGPVLAAGLLAHIDIEKAPTVGHIWSFAGLDPTKKWGKGQKRPWNARLKTLCWKIGDCFVKVSNRPDDLYGKLYKERKEYEISKNLRGEYAEQAAEILRTKNIGRDTEAYKYYVQGLLPPGHIDMRARRYAVKQFLADLHYVWYRYHFKKEPPKPYPIAILGHAHEREKPLFRTIVPAKRAIEKDSTRNRERKSI